MPIEKKEGKEDEIFTICIAIFFLLMIAQKVRNVYTFQVSVFKNVSEIK